MRASERDGDDQSCHTRRIRHSAGILTARPLAAVIGIFMSNYARPIESLAIPRSQELRASTNAVINCGRPCMTLEKLEVLLENVIAYSRGRMHSRPRRTSLVVDGDDGPDEGVQGWGAHCKARSVYSESPQVTRGVGMMDISKGYAPRRATQGVRTSRFVCARYRLC